MATEKLQVHLPDEHGNEVPVDIVTTLDQVIDETTGESVNTEVMSTISHPNDVDVHITPQLRAIYNAKSEFDGSYSNLVGTPDIPSIVNAVDSIDTESAASSNALNIANERVKEAEALIPIKQTEYRNTLVGNGMNVAAGSTFDQMNTALQNWNSPNNLNGIALEDIFKNETVIEISKPDTKITSMMDDILFNNTIAGSCIDCAYSPDGIHLVVGTSTNPYIVVYKKSGDKYTQITTDIEKPAMNISKLAFSPDGTHLAISTSNSAPYLTIYERNGDKFTKILDPAIAAVSDYVMSVSYSGDGAYMAISLTSSPYLSIFKRNGNVYTKLANPSVMPSSGGHLAFSPDSTYLFMTSTSSPYLVIYKRSGDTFTKLANPSVAPTGLPYGVGISQDSIYFAVAHMTSPFITIYKRSGDTFTKLANPSVLPPDTGWRVSFTNNGTEMIVAHNSTNVENNRGIPITRYSRSGDTFTKINDDNVLYGVDVGSAISFADDHIAIGASTKRHPNLPNVVILKRVGNVLNRVADVLCTPIDNAFSTAVSPDNKHLVVGSNTFPFFTMYKNDNGKITKLESIIEYPTSAVYCATYSNDGKYLLVGVTATPFIYAYKRDGDKYTRLNKSVFSELPASSGVTRSISFTSDDKYILVGYYPKFMIYKRSGDTFTKLPDPTGGDMPTNGVFGSKISPDATHLLIGPATSPYIFTYKKDLDETWFKADMFTEPPPGIVYGVDYSPDGSIVALAHSGTPYISLYKRAGDSYTKLPNPSMLPVGNATGCEFSKNGDYLAVSHNTSPYFTLYRIKDSVLTKVKSPVSAILPKGAANGVSFSPDGKYLIIAHFTAPYVTIYELGDEGLRPVSNHKKYKDYITNIGIAKNNVKKFESLDYRRIWKK